MGRMKRVDVAKVRRGRGGSNGVLPTGAGIMQCGDRLDNLDGGAVGGFDWTE